jgi:hypothetical protein
MNCEYVSDNITQLVAGTLTAEDALACKTHIAACRDCRDALHGAVAMRTMRDRGNAAPPAGLFERITTEVTRPKARERAPRFWLGAAFGGALAASLLATAIALGILVRPVALPQDDVARFSVATYETRPMEIAIDVDRPLAGAKISVMLAGDVEVEGFGSLRELSWSDDLESGVNRLTLPLRAIGEDVGQVVVRLSHPDSEQLFVVKLKLDS